MVTLLATKVLDVEDVEEDDVEVELGDGVVEVGLLDAVEGDVVVVSSCFGSGVLSISISISGTVVEGVRVVDC